MNVNLKKISLQNFKGTKDKTFDFKGESAVLIGKNGSGKSTVVDAFFWLFFNKNSAGETKFDIKPLDKDNNPINRLITSVYAELEVDEKVTQFKREYKEKWTKKRSSPIEELTGHESNYFVDGVPVNETEFKRTLEVIFPSEELFKLCSDIRYFANLKWEDKVAKLKTIAQIPTDEDILKEFPELELNGRTPENHKAVLAASFKSTKEQLDSFGYRIDEQSKNLKEDKDISEIQKQISNLSEQRETLMNEKSRIDKEKSGIHAKRMELLAAKMNVESELKTAEYNFKRESEQGKKEISDKYEDASKEYAATEKAIESCNTNIASLTSKIHSNEKELDELRAKGKELLSKVFCAENLTDCPTCNQPLEGTAFLEYKTKELEQNFNKQKAKNLSEINERGASLKKQIEEDKNTLNELDILLKQEKAKLSELADKKLTLYSALSEIQQHKTVEFVPSKDLTSRIAKLNAEISSLDAQLNTNTQNETESQIRGLNEQIEALKSSLVEANANEAIKSRIAELKEEHKKTVETATKLQYQLSLINNFFGRKRELIAKSVNDLFVYVKFKMFDLQINGEYKDTCEILINGVPFSGANTASKINAGVDICRIFQSCNDFYCPIFVDNAESVSEIIETNCQRISLVVDKDAEEVTLINK